MLCNHHRVSGAPAYHTPGCEACDEARAKGIIRPDIGSVPPKQRGRRRHLEKQYDWNKVPVENRHALACAISAGRFRGEP
jgi:hypothetical protein